MKRDKRYIFKNHLLNKLNCNKLFQLYQEQVVQKLEMVPQWAKKLLVQISTVTSNSGRAKWRPLRHSVVTLTNKIKKQLLNPHESLTVVTSEKGSSWKKKSVYFCSSFSVRSGKVSPPSLQRLCPAPPAGRRSSDLSWVRLISSVWIQDLGLEPCPEFCCSAQIFVSTTEQMFLWCFSHSIHHS